MTNHAHADRRKRYRARQSDARVVAFRVGMAGPRSLSTDAKCGLCGHVFRFGVVPIPDFGLPPARKGTEEPGPASTGPWVAGACPQCQRGHRVRATVVVVIEEEEDALFAPEPDGGIVGPVPKPTRDA